MGEPQALSVALFPLIVQLFAALLKIPPPHPTGEATGMSIMS